MTALHLAEALQLADDMRAALAEADLGHVDVTLDGRRLTGRALAQRGGVLVQAPSIDFPTYGPGACTFTAVVAAGPPDREVEAWQRIDAIISALLDAGLPITEARPAVTVPADGPPIPAYELTLTQP